MARYRVAIDTGGTFTDAFIFEEETGAVRVTKVPSTPQHPDQAVLRSLEAAGVEPGEISLLTHGTTVATNALITRRLPRTAMITTEGFRDVVEIRDGTKNELWDAYADVAPPYIRRRDRFEVRERVDYGGRVVEPLDEAGARAVARLLDKRGYESVAICFLNAYMNPANERRMRELLEGHLPDGTFLCTSSEVLPEMFEHPRFSTTMINAVTGPVVGRYIVDLDRALAARGYRGDLLILHSGGGVLTAKGASRYAARLASSGIVAGAIAGGHIARQCGFANAISLDMGGTSTDISLMYRDELRTMQGWQVEYGYPMMFPSVEVITIGAGGGSIAWIDAGGSLRNGPQSAGADPGPAAYGGGGRAATNTDANLVLGRLGGSLLDGQVALDAAAARRAIDESIAGPLGLETVAAAHAIVRVANANMSDAVKLMSVGRGFDPRDFTLVVFGGAGPLHGAHLARELDIPTVVFPRHPGIASAMGCLLVDIRHDLTLMYLAHCGSVDLASLEGSFRELEREAEHRLREEKVAPDDMRFTRHLEMRYAGQWRALSVALDSGPIASLDAILDRFHREHRRTYAFSDPAREVEIYSLRLVATGVVPKPEPAPSGVRGGTSDALVGQRSVYFEEVGGFTGTPVYRRERLPPGVRLAGPAVVEQLDTTVVLPPGTAGDVDAYGNIVMRFV